MDGVSRQRLWDVVDHPKLNTVSQVSGWRLDLETGSSGAMREEGDGNI
jgi:hypothetical protein